MYVFCQVRVILVYAGTQFEVLGENDLKLSFWVDLVFKVFLWYKNVMIPFGEGKITRFSRHHSTSLDATAKTASECAKIPLGVLYGIYRLDLALLLFGFIFRCLSAPVMAPSIVSGVWYPNG